MSEKVLKVLSNAQQGLTNEQKAQARLNIGCAGTYHAGTNIAIDSSTNTISVSGLATVATTGRYSDLSGTPTIPEQVNADWNAVSGKAQILNKPTVTEVKELTGSTAYGPVYTNVPTLTLGNQIISTDTSGSNAAFGIVAPVPTSSDVGKSLVAGNGSTHWETVNPGGKLLKHTATFVRVVSTTITVTSALCLSRHLPLPQMKNTTTLSCSTAQTPAEAVHSTSKTPCHALNVVAALAPAVNTCA